MEQHILIMFKVLCTAKFRNEFGAVIPNSQLRNQDHQLLPLGIHLLNKFKQVAQILLDHHLLLFVGRDSGVIGGFD